jgi:hypothetical protein
MLHTKGSSIDEPFVHSDGEGSIFPVTGKNKPLSYSIVKNRGSSGTRRFGNRYQMPPFPNFPPPHFESGGEGNEHGKKTVDNLF